jgi:hypothetical protein
MLVAHLLRLWLVNLETMLYLFLLHVLKYLYGDNYKIIALLEYGEPPRKTVQPQYYMALVLAN